MSRIEKKLKLSDEKFKRRIGTTKPVFQTMLDILQTAHDKLHKQHSINRPKKNQEEWYGLSKKVL